MEKGWTFNDDGTLVEFKIPNLLKDLDEQISYEVPNEAYINSTNYGRSKVSKM